ncbi:dihydropteroate synthase [Haliovirga abyssi]|uniref:Dihydropteroate synthase n=1 Tax=Haliovirga abyssi TaxID=2996794 RepID=A0AAU9DC90_9FUSO|nr:dihydropteroate synthase [Haliovirga abyssi]BDU49907.1 dihydropteroate synthase [Haliovirga abyssi]
MSGNKFRVIEIDDFKDAKKRVKDVVSGIENIKRLQEKTLFRAIEIKNLDARAANILNYEALSCNVEAIISEDVFNFSVKTTDIILLGTIRNYEKLYYRLKTKKFGLSKLSEELKDTLLKYDSNYEEVTVGDYTFNFNEKTYIMGILNITPDSFSDGGNFLTPELAIKRAIEMKKNGADIIDIGAESSRPGATPVTAEQELERLIPVVEELRKEIDLPISIDTYKSEVAKEMLERGVHIINDITGLKGDPKLSEVISDYEALAVIMHMQGTPQNMQKNPEYEDVVADVIEELRKSIQIAEISGIRDKNIIVDPGIGFGKTVKHNLEIFKRLKEFKSLGMPILIGASRKSMIGEILDLPIGERIEGSVALAVAASLKGASILRVHDVKETYRALKMIDAIKNI